MLRTFVRFVLVKSSVATTFVAAAVPELQILILKLSLSPFLIVCTVPTWLGIQFDE